MDVDEVVMLKQDGSNYPNWSHFMSQYMIQTRRQLWDYVCGIVTEPNPGHENFTNLSQQWKTKNAVILNIICACVHSPSVRIQLRHFKSGKEAWDYLAELYGHSNFAKKYQLETQIRATKQGDRTIREFHGVMVGLWNQQAKREDRDLSLLSSYKKNQDEQHLVQFLIALRDEFEPIRRSILCRFFLPSVEKAVRELEEEEMRLNKPSIVSEFDQSHKFNKPSSSYDWPSLLGGLAKVATFSFAAVQVPRTLYNYYTEPGTELKILSYNVCFREDLEIHKRMKAVGDLIQLHSPDLICFQEVTLNVYDIFQQSSWWKLYRCLVSSEMAYTRRAFCMQLSKLPVKSCSRKAFSNSTMERELCVAEVEVQADMPLVIATSHLKSPGPGPFGWDDKFCKERVDQAKEALAFLKKNVNVIFCGDMNWDDDLDGQFPLLRGWVDAWVQLKPGENGWTYDTKSNQMLFGDWPLQKRLDRFVCNLSDFKIRSIDMIGTEAIPGLSFCKERKVKNKVHKLMLPVFPSDHYGLLLTICAK